MESYVTGFFTSLSFFALMFMFIPAILCIILFFKIWGMTNDIKDMKYILRDISESVRADENINDTTGHDIQDNEDNIQKIDEINENALESESKPVIDFGKKIPSQLIIIGLSIVAILIIANAIILLS